MVKLIAFFKRLPGTTVVSRRPHSLAASGTSACCCRLSRDRAGHAPGAVNDLLLDFLTLRCR
jgi:hypothetical protein